MKRQLLKSFIFPIAVVLVSGFLLWIGSTLFTISGNQRELQTKITSIEKDTTYLRTRVDALFNQRQSLLFPTANSEESIKIVRKENKHGN